jgi:hypothetical protein
VTVTIPLVLVLGIVALACYRWMGLRFWQLLVCLTVGFLLAATSFAPEIHNILNTVFNGGRK